MFVLWKYGVIVLFLKKKNYDKGWEILKILNIRGWFKCYNDEM